VLYNNSEKNHTKKLQTQVIDPDHTKKRMNPVLPRTDSLVLLSDGAPPSPHSPTGFIPTSDGPASYSTFSKNAKEANSRREVEKRLAETAAEADRRANEAAEIEAKAQQDVASNEARRLAYLALAKQQWEDMEAQKADSKREAQKADFFEDENNFDLQSNASEHEHDEQNATTTSRPSFSRKRKTDQIYMSNVAKPVVHVDEISSDLANKFLQHCERPEVIQQNLQWDQVIQPYALECIRFRLTHPKFHHLVLPEHVDTFPLCIVDGEEVCVISLLEIATVIRKIFNITPELSEEQSLEQQGREHSCYGGTRTEKGKVVGWLWSSR
jgi:hypothetical protein